MIFLVTGEKNQGKTSYMQSFYEEIKEGDGFICPKVFKNGKFVRYDIKRLSTGETLPFACSVDNLPDRWDEACRYQHYSFSGKAIRFAEEIIDEIIVSRKEPVIIDEIGPLEIERHEGFYQLMRKIIQSDLGIFISIRKCMTIQFITVFDIENFKVIPVGMLAEETNSSKIRKRGMNDRFDCQ